MDANVKLEIIGSYDSLVERLQFPISGIEVVVIQASTREELEALIPLKAKLMRLRIILILPDANPEILSLGHQFCPRFLTSIDANFEHVEAVLQRMQNNYSETALQEH